jgi:hypothetical protein
MPDRRTLQRWSYAVVGVAGGIALVSLPPLLFPAPRPVGDTAFMLLRMASVAMALAWSGGFGLMAFLKADEFNRERAKFAWYWGSCLGIAASVLVVALVRLFGLPQLAGLALGGHDNFRVFAAGVGLPILAQVLASALVSLWWKVTKR